MRTGASSGPRATVGSDSRRGCVADGVVGPDGDAVREPVAGDTTGDIGTDIVDINHGNGVETLKLRAILRRGHGDGRSRVDLCAVRMHQTRHSSAP